MPLEAPTAIIRIRSFTGAPTHSSSIENVMMIARFEFLFDSFESLIDSTDPGEVKRTGTVPMIYFRLELPGLTLGEFVQVDRSSLYHAPASC